MDTTRADDSLREVVPYGEKCAMMPRKPRRNTLRYAGYDYRQAGCYFVTICTHARQPLFGSVADGLMLLSPAGDLVERCWLDIEARTPGAGEDRFVVMPDHLHGILTLGADPAIPTNVGLPDIVKTFKNRVQALYRHQVHAGTLTPYAGRLWQRHYYDRIIRSDQELQAIREYITGNPARWHERHNRYMPTDP